MAMNLNGYIGSVVKSVANTAKQAAEQKSNQAVQNAKKYISDNGSNAQTTPKTTQEQNGKGLVGAFMNNVRKASPEQISNALKSVSANPIYANAVKYLGTPYVWAGSDMKEHGGMDCSGFVYRALRDSGYDVQREDAQGYRKFGTVIPKSKMQVGDIIFFGNNNDASHIGIYAGNGKMIHSSGGESNTRANPGLGVSFKNVDERSDFLEARRI